MALRGNLRDFSLPDVFQLITFSRKTGVLRIRRSDDAQGAVWFREGDVFFASSNWHAELLGERLVKAQRITEQALERALSIRAGEPADGRRLGEILIDEGYISDQVLETFVTEQIQDTIFDLMRWDEGEFDFEPMPELEDEDIGLSVSMENVVMEGSRRLEEWNRIRKKIPSTDVAFKMATAPGEGTFEISLKPLEWQLLLLVDGSRSVADLARDTERTDFEVARVIYGLFSAGLLEFATDEEIEQSRKERAEREKHLAEVLASRAATAAPAARPAAAAEPASAPEQAAAESTAAGAPGEPSGEMPEFLGAETTVPTDDDEAALAAFMGAVLGASEPAAPSVEPSPAPAAPHIPAEEPAFFSPSAQAAGAESAAPSVEELLGIGGAIPAVEPELEAGESLAGSVASAEPPSEMTGDAGAAPESREQAERTPAETDAEGPGAESSGFGFEHDLIALGLGELPTDLLEPITSSAASEQAAEQVPAVEAQGAGASDWGSSDVPPLEPVAEPMSVLGDMAGAEEPAAQAEEPDFSALLQSLDIDAANGSAGAPAVDVAPQQAQDFDAELLLQHDEPAPGAVISTDAYLEDIKITDLGLTDGLTDELSALTGVERRQSARPQASVRAIPDETTHTLARDDRVDRETLLKIIDGIKSL